MARERAAIDFLTDVKQPKSTKDNLRNIQAIYNF